MFYYFRELLFTFTLTSTKIVCCEKMFKSTQWPSSAWMKQQIITSLFPSIIYWNKSIQWNQWKYEDSATLINYWLSIVRVEHLLVLALWIINLWNNNCSVWWSPCHHHQREKSVVPHPHQPPPPPPPPHLLLLNTLQSRTGDHQSRNTLWSSDYHSHWQRIRTI